MYTILVVEDEFGVADLVRLTLEEEGFLVLAASNGAEALRQLATATPDVIVTDYMMPVMDGPTLVRTLRSNANWADLPIVVMSAMSEEMIRARFESHVQFLQKPFRLEYLVQVVKSALNAQRSS